MGEGIPHIADWLNLQVPKNPNIENSDAIMRICNIYSPAVTTVLLICNIVTVMGSFDPQNKLMV